MPLPLLRFPVLLILSFAACGLLPESRATRQASRQPAWEAQWVRAPDTAEKAYGVYHFRRELELDEQPEQFRVHLSADSRYKLFVNGELASLGPAAGDYYHWNYETVDLAPYLRRGSNILAALVWNEGDYRQQAQISLSTGFLLQGASEGASIANTGPEWKSLRNEAYSPLPGIGYRTYYVSGPGEEVDFALYPSGWTEPDFDDSAWPFAEPLSIGRQGRGNPKGSRDASGWMLVPRLIPSMELQPQRFAAAREVEGIAIDTAFLAGEITLEVPPRTRARAIVDHGVLTNAYTELVMSGGRSAVVQLSYAESLFDEDPALGPMIKGDRNEVAGKFFAGRKDRLISSGAERQRFTTLSYRTFRYVELIIETGEEPLRLESFASVFAGYPFELKSSFSANRPEMGQILEIGWRTARLCAMETYMDCPYYEQLQYIGDTRIQALVSLYNTGDDRLLRNALNLIDQSRIAEGVTLSRHPSISPQIISTFSLWYIGMLHDYWRYGRRPDFVAEKLAGAREVLRFFERFQSSDGTLREAPYWLFTDWVRDRGWDYGEAPIGAGGESSPLDFQLLWAYQVAAELEAALGMPAFAERYRERARQLQESIRTLYWDEDRRLFRDTFDEDPTYSQHANALAILTGTVEGDEARALAEQLLQSEGIAQASIYFKYYLHQALAKAGLGDGYLDWLGIWRRNMELGLTTWAETSDVVATRSDCHAWGSSPNIEFFRLILGIDTAASGFKRVRIQPNLGSLERASGSIPHPDGELSVSYRKRPGRWEISIDLPGELEGELVWEGESIPLASGSNAFRLVAR